MKSDDPDKIAGLDKYCIWDFLQEGEQRREKGQLTQFQEINYELLSSETEESSEEEIAIAKKEKLNDEEEEDEDEALVCDDHHKLKYLEYFQPYAEKTYNCS